MVDRQIGGDEFPALLVEPMTQSPSNSAPDSPRTQPVDVLVVVANRVSTDPRVMRQVDALCALGLQVAVLGVAGEADQPLEKLPNGSVIQRVAIPTAARDRSWRSTGRARLRRRQRLVDRQARAAARRKAIERSRPAGSRGVLVRAGTRMRWRFARIREEQFKRRVRRFPRSLRVRFAEWIDQIPWLAAWERDLPLQRDLDQAFAPAIRRSDARIVHADIVPPTSQNQRQMEEDLTALLPDLLDRDDEEVAWQSERLVRSYDPCISCATHFLKVKVERL
jgi:hypothetical protein